MRTLSRRSAHAATDECATARQTADPKLPHGTRFCRCASCGVYFRNVAAFEIHRVGVRDDRGCLQTPQMSGAGLQLDSSGYWRLPKRKFRRTHLRLVSSRAAS